MLTQGFPRLVTVSRDTLVADADGGDALPKGVQARVLLNDDAVLIPDIGVVEASLHEALAAYVGVTSPTPPDLRGASGALRRPTSRQIGSASGRRRVGRSGIVYVGPVPYTTKK